MNTLEIIHLRSSGEPLEALAASNAGARAGLLTPDLPTLRLCLPPLAPRHI